jgi:hypothetical protein
MAESKISVKAMDAAILDQRSILFQAMGIVRMVSRAIQGGGSGSRESTVDAWTSLDGAYAMLGSIADRLQDSETMLAVEVDRGEY